ncbi:hypothetical protein N0V88_005543 [Collariella sp. IMI 366227]|nr:hypothetical protein N0V88_005543 [Collariella sp. IMI 366227]
MVLQAALSDIQIEFIDGVIGKDVVDKAVPMSSPDDKRPPDAVLGSWRAHMNAIREIVHRNLSSALILEDDADWDIRIRDQLHDFALSAHALTQSLRGRRGVYADSTYPQPSDDSPESVPELNFYHLPATTPNHLPTVPKGRVIRLHDETVAPKKNLWTFNIPFTLKEAYPEHTRAYHHVQEGVCTLGYAVSRRGAQKLLHEVALKEVGEAYDILLRAYCEGERGRRPGRQCLATQPSLFHHHRPAGPLNAISDISNHGGNGEFRDTAMTDMVRWSVRLNADALMEGRTNFVDQFPDE